MLSRKSDQPKVEETEVEESLMESEEYTDDGATPLPIRPQARGGGGSVRPSGNPEIVRRAPDIPTATNTPRRQAAAETEEKKLIVGREIVLSGEINSCDHLVVEGRVEANIANCREIDIAETGTFKGEAEIDFADISGNFEGSITAADLLLVRSTGRVTGTVRFGQIEIERGGQIVGDVQTVSDSQPASRKKAATATETAAE